MASICEWAKESLFLNVASLRKKASPLKRSKQRRGQASNWLAQTHAYLQDAGHDGAIGEMAGELRLIGGDALDSDSHLARDIFENFVHEEERIPAQRRVSTHVCPKDSLRACEFASCAPTFDFPKACKFLGIPWLHAGYFLTMYSQCIGGHTLLARREA
jgi:hypothetical protein